MKNNFIYLLLYLINFKLNSCLTILDVDPPYIQIQQNGGEQSIILTFDESVENDNSGLILTYNEEAWEITLKRSSPPKGSTNPYRAYFYFDHNDFYNKKFFGYYKIYYGKESITTDIQILIYLNSIRLKNSKDRYFLIGEGTVNCTFELDKPIIKEEVYHISLSDGQNRLDNCTYYLEEDGSVLIISIDRANRIRTYNFNIYPIYDKETNNPPNVNAYFQNFFVHYEAVYVNASAESSFVSIRIDFKTNTYYGVQFLLEYSGTGSVTFEDNGFTRDDNNNITYNFIIYKPSPGIIYIKYINQIRPIYLITYQTNSNKCYISGSRQIFEIKFFKTSEMEYTHSVFFNSTPYQILRIQNENSNQPIYTHAVTYLYQGTFNLYSRISKLSSNDYNPIDISSLNIKIYDDPILEDNENKTLYISIEQPQFLTFNMSRAGNVNEIILVSSKASKEIKLSLNECEIINNIYNCSYITKILKNLDETYIADDYIVEYASICDNQRLRIKNKKIIIRKGINLLNVNPNWTFIDNLPTTEITLTYSDIIEGNANIIFCKRNNIHQCEGKEVNSTKNTIILDFNGFPQIEEIYDIYLLMNGQLIKNDKIIFKVLKRLDFIFNHQYFVRDNGADENHLNITKNFIEENNNIIYNIQDDLNNNLTTVNNRSFIYDINNCDFLGEIRFKYFDNDIQSYIPINKTIYVSNTINELFSFHIRDCYYYKFKLEITKRNYFNFIERIFLTHNNKVIEFDKIDNNEYKLKLENEKDINNLIDNKELIFYISENIIDEKIYLYKSKFSVTNIGVPEYIISPNSSLYFSNVTCNLCEAKFQMFDNLFHGGKKLQKNCQFFGNYMIINGFIEPLYNYYYYSIDDEYITDINNSSKFLSTFRTVRLSRSSFIINIDEETNKTHLKIKIINNKKDFYCKLISNLTLYKITNDKNNTKIVLNRNSKSNEFQILNNEISFIIEKGNFKLDIDHLTRDKAPWEINIDSSFYYYFLDETNFSNITVTPTIFASNDFTKEDLIINIKFNNTEIKNKAEKDLENLCLTKKDINILEVECTLNLTKENLKNEPKKLKKYLLDYLIEIDLIYYTLSSPFKCITLDGNKNNFNLIIYVPDEYYIKDRIYLKYNTFPYESDYADIDFDKKTIAIPIDIIFNDTLIIYIFVDNKLIKSFSLKEFDIKYIPKFDFEEKGNDIFLLPQKNQLIKLTYIQDIVELLDYELYKDNISYFQIGNIAKSIRIENNDDGGIFVIFDLSSFNSSKQNYTLFYFDTCGNKINTGINISIFSFYFERHYFVLNNNNNQQPQNLRIQGPINNQIELYIIDENGEDERIFSNGNIYIYRLTKSGNYSFYYINNNIRTNIEDKVYVVDELSDLFNITTNLTECMFYNISKYLYFSFTFKIERMDNSFFNMTLKIEGDNQNYSLNSISNNNLSYMLTYNTIRDRINQNKTLVIYLYENNDMAQPLYRYKYKYTNITLNSLYEDVIYTDAIYILFNMSCKIDNLQDFYLYEASSPLNNKGVIKCKSFELTNLDNIYNCTLYEDNINNNSIINPKFKYDYYIMKYDSQPVILYF